MRAVLAAAIAWPFALGSILQAQGPLDEPPPSKRLVDTVIESAELEAFRAMHEPVTVAWAEALEPLEVREGNSLRSATLRLYRTDGAVDEAVLDQFAWVVSREDDPVPITPRVIQLAFKAAYHFHAREIDIVSAFRPQVPFKGSRHATGDALDFRLPGTKASLLAAYLRKIPRVGVGIYTHPRTQYVHLDVRDESFHWLDGSPPGKNWREQAIVDYGRAKRDASYTPEGDLP